MPAPSGTVLVVAASAFSKRTLRPLRSGCGQDGRRGLGGGVAPWRDARERCPHWARRCPPAVFPWVPGSNATKQGPGNFCKMYVFYYNLDS